MWGVTGKTRQDGDDRYEYDADDDDYDIDDYNDGMILMMIAMITILRVVIMLIAMITILRV